MDRKNILILSIFTLITAVGWIAFDVYHAATDTTIPQSIEKQVTPITPTFEKGIIDRVKERSHVAPLEEGTLQPKEEGASKESSGASEIKKATASAGQ